jgi:hypothetical protein
VGSNLDEGSTPHRPQFNFGTRLIARSMARRGQDAWRYLFTRRPPGKARPYLLDRNARDRAR